MRTCPTCGRTVGDNVKFCPGCGGKLPQGNVCPACGRGKPGRHGLLPVLRRAASGKRGSPRGGRFKPAAGAKPGAVPGPVPGPAPKLGAAHAGPDDAGPDDARTSYARTAAEPDGTGTRRGKETEKEDVPREKSSPVWQRGGRFAGHHRSAGPFRFSAHDAGTESRPEQFVREGMRSVLPERKGRRSAPDEPTVYG